MSTDNKDETKARVGVKPPIELPPPKRQRVGEPIPLQPPPMPPLAFLNLPDPLPIQTSPLDNFGIGMNPLLPGTEIMQNLFNETLRADLTATSDLASEDLFHTTTQWAISPKDMKIETNVLDSIAPVPFPLESGVPPLAPSPSIPPPIMDLGIEPVGGYGSSPMSGGSTSDNSSIPPMIPPIPRGSAMSLFPGVDQADLDSIPGGDGFALDPQAQDDATLATMKSLGLRRDLKVPVEEQLRKMNPDLVRDVGLPHQEDSMPKKGKRGKYPMEKWTKDLSEEERIKLRKKLAQARYRDRKKQTAKKRKEMLQRVKEQLDGLKYFQPFATMEEHRKKCGLRPNYWSLVVTEPEFDVIATQGMKDALGYDNKGLNDKNFIRFSGGEEELARLVKEIETIGTLTSEPIIQRLAIQNGSFRWIWVQTIWRRLSDPGVKPMIVHVVERSVHKAVICGQQLAARMEQMGVTGTM